MSTRDCIKLIRQAAGRPLGDSEIQAIFERIHKAALDINAGRVKGEEIGLGRKLQKQMPFAATKATDRVMQQAAQLAADELRAEAALAERQAALQVIRLSGLTSTFRALVSGGLKPLDAVDVLIHRDYSGRTNVASLEQQVTGYRDYFLSKLQPTWDALGSDFAGFFQDRAKMRDLILELRGEDSGNALAKRGAQAFREAAEEARQLFNQHGGNIAKLDDWGMPQHHSQELVAWSGREAWLQSLPEGERATARLQGTPPPAEFARAYWVDFITPMLDRARYVDEFGTLMTDAELRTFLERAWDNIATDGLATIEPGAFRGVGKRAMRHAEHRQIHFKDADSLIRYWESFGDKSAVEILYGHISSMARDIAFIELFGPNPNTTFRTLRDTAYQEAAVKEPARKGEFDRQVNKLDTLWDYASGKTKAPANLRFAALADTIANLNVAGKLGGAALASFFGDKPIMEAVSHMNDLPMIKRWTNELAMLSPTNAVERRLLQRQGLMLDSVRSGLHRFYEGLGRNTWSGKVANGVMRISGMQAINDLRKGSFGLTLMDAIGNEIRAGRAFGQLPDSDVRTLRNYGITESDWKLWQLADLEDMGRGNDAVLTPNAIQRIDDARIQAEGLVPEGGTAADAKRNAMVKLLGAVNTESEFAIVTPGWQERAAFYGRLRRGTFSGEITRSILQFKAFPWAYLQRGMDAVANMEGPVPKAAMVAYIIASTTLAGAMLYQTRQILAGKDPLKMADENWLKFWGQSFLYGGALGIYGDFLYGVSETRHGSGPLEMMLGPSLGPLSEIFAVQPLQELEKSLEGKETHFWAKELADIKGFVPGSNLWYAKAALDHLIWQQVLEQLSPGYLNTIRRRMQRDYNQAWFWDPGTAAPQRLPDLPQAWQAR